MCEEGLVGVKKEKDGTEMDPAGLLPERGPVLGINCGLRQSYGLTRYHEQWRERIY
jgi:hypothetical protein